LNKLRSSFGETLGDIVNVQRRKREGRRKTKDHRTRRGKSLPTNGGNTSFPMTGEKKGLPVLLKGGRS